MERGALMPEREPGRSATSAELELFARIESTLYTAVLADSLDELGYRDQAMRETLRPLTAACCFAGWARTISCIDMYHFRLLSRICGVILVPGVVPSCDRGRFPWPRRYESRRIVWLPLGFCC